jgi:hypothetical protein
MSKARLRAKLLARGRPVSPPLLAPLVVAAAAEIEALAVADVVTDPTRLARALTAMQAAIGVDAIVTTAADGLAAETAGATADLSTYPPTLAAPAGGVPGATAALRTPPSRSVAAIEATRRLVATTDDVVVGAALDGPAAVAAQLGDDAADPDVIERAGRVVLDVAGAFLEAGAHLLVVVESAPLASAAREAWRSAVNPIGNVARFRQAAPVVVVADPDDADIVPGATAVCLPGGKRGGRGVALPSAAAAWAGADVAGVPIVTTLGAVADGFAAVRSGIDGLRQRVGSS